MPETPEPQAGTEPKPEAPPWGDSFDAEKAWALVQNLRADKERLATRPVMTDEQKQQLTEYQRLVEASKSDLDRKTEEVTRWQTEAEKWRTASVGSRIEVLAGPDFADPSDAATALADSAKYLGVDGVINDAAIKADLAAVLDKKPHWRRQEGAPAPRVPAPNPAQGSGVNGRAAADPATEFAALIQGQLGSR